MMSNILELGGIAMVLFAAYLDQRAFIVGLIGVLLIATEYARGKK